MYNIVLIGPPGSGKGTFSECLNVLGYLKIGLGDILRDNIFQLTPHGIEAKKYLETNDNIPDQLAYHLVFERIKSFWIQNKPFVLEGFPSTEKQFFVFFNFLKKNEILRSIKFINLDICKQLCLKRIVSRLICQQCHKIYNLNTRPPKNGNDCDECHSKLMKRKEDNSITANKRINFFYHNTLPILNIINNSIENWVIKEPFPFLKKN